MSTPAPWAAIPSPREAGAFDVVHATSSRTESAVVARDVLPHNAPLVVAAPDLAEAAHRLLRWFTPAEGALGCRELLLPGCPNELRGDIERLARAVLRARGAL